LVFAQQHLITTFLIASFHIRSWLSFDHLVSSHQHSVFITILRENLALWLVVRSQITTHYLWPSFHSTY
jgi:hypothetical protein